MTFTKHKKLSNYQKALEKMKQETARAIAHVRQLEKLHDEMKAKSQKLDR